MPSPASGRPMIELKNLTLSYGKYDIIREADLTIQHGETCIILGPSGVGKSTILKAILGLLKPAQGEIYIEGELMTGHKEKDLARFRQRMSMVFQHGALFDAMTVGQNVSFRMRELKLASAQKIQARIEEVLNFVGLTGARDLKPAQLSGGMKKRVAIARGLAPDPEIFLFDEPTVGLDPVNLYNIEQLILKLKARKNTTMVIVTHDIESAVLLADTVVMLHEGRFIFKGSPAELQQSTDERIRTFLNPAAAAPDKINQPGQRRNLWNLWK